MSWFTLKYSLILNAVLVLALVTGGLVARSSAAAAAAEKKLAVDTASSLRGYLDTADSNLAQASIQHGTTRASLTMVREQLDVCQSAKQVIAKQNREATDRIARELADADKALAQITDNFAAALRDPACTICMNQPICPRLVK